jgi:putative copper resistance protein D
MPDWIGLVSLACCTGVLVCSLWVVGSAQADPSPVSEDLLAGMWQLFRIGAAALLVSSILGLLVRAHEMSGYPMTGVLPALPTVLLRTHLGHAWLLRMAAIVALLASITAAGGTLRSRPSRWFMLGCAVVVSAMDSASGHASDAGDFSAPEIMDWLHLSAALLWGGALVVLSLKILPQLVKQGDRAASSMAGIATRFSKIAGVAVGFIVLTASYQQWVYGGTLEGLPRSPFGRILIAKIVLFSALLILGAINRYVSVPRLQEWAGAGTTRHGALGRLIVSSLVPFAPTARGTQAAARFARTVQLEAVLLAAVLLCAALLRHEAPAGNAARMEHHALAH